jgi:hypothetical protein
MAPPASARVVVDTPSLRQTGTGGSATGAGLSRRQPSPQAVLLLQDWRGRARRLLPRPFAPGLYDYDDLGIVLSKMP